MFYITRIFFISKDPTSIIFLLIKCIVHSMLLVSLILNANKN